MSVSVETYARSSLIPLGESIEVDGAIPTGYDGSIPKDLGGSILEGEAEAINDDVAAYARSTPTPVGETIDGSFPTDCDGPIATGYDGVSTDSDGSFSDGSIPTGYDGGPTGRNGSNSGADTKAVAVNVEAYDKFTPTPFGKSISAGYNDSIPAGYAGSIPTGYGDSVLVGDDKVVKGNEVQKRTRNAKANDLADLGSLCSADKFVKGNAVQKRKRKAKANDLADLGSLCSAFTSEMHVSWEDELTCKRMRNEGDESDSDDDEIDVKAVQSDDLEVQIERWDRRLGKTLGLTVTQVHVDAADVIRSFLLCRAKHRTTQSFFKWLHQRPTFKRCGIGTNHVVWLSQVVYPQAGRSTRQEESSANPQEGQEAHAEYEWYHFGRATYGSFGTLDGNSIVETLSQPEIVWQG
jgi:hypothetical protein